MIDKRMQERSYEIAKTLSLLRGRAQARPHDPEPSLDAAEHMVETGATTQLENEIVDYLRKGGRWGTQELARALDRNLSSVTPRMKNLERKGLIRKDGKKLIVNGNDNERLMTVWTYDPKEE